MTEVTLALVGTHQTHGGCVMVASFDIARSLAMVLRRHFDDDKAIIALLNDLRNTPSTPVFQSIISRLLLEIKASPRVQREPDQARPI